MADKDHVEAILCSASLVDLERLIRGIDRHPIIDLLKHSEHLRRQVFPGFRPTHLPWALVPTRLARNAHGDIAKMSKLLDMWLATNEPLCEAVAEKVGVETTDDDVARLLAGLGVEERERILWALLLDERGEIQKALADGLRDALTAESSALLVRAEQYRPVVELEEARREIAELKTQIERLEEQGEYLHRKAEHINDLRTEQQHLRGELEQVKADRQEAVHQRDAARQETETLQVDLTRERARRSELQRSVDDLKASLEAAIASQQETASEVKRRLDETLATLEDARKENAKLRLKASRLEEDLDSAYNKRDEEQARAEVLATQQKRLEHDKEILVSEKRKLHAQLEQVCPELDRLRENLATIEEERRATLALSHFADSWDRVIDALSRHLALMLSEQGSLGSTVRVDERWADWQTWQQMEAALVKPLLELPPFTSVENLADVAKAQKLLTLRWYLLEWLKLSMLDALQSSNRVIGQIESREEVE